MFCGNLCNWVYILLCRGNNALLQCPACGLLFVAVPRPNSYADWAPSRPRRPPRPPGGVNVSVVYRCQWVRLSRSQSAITLFVTHLFLFI